MKRVFSLAILFSLMVAGKLSLANDLPDPADQFNIVTIEAAQPLNDRDGNAVSGKYVLTLDSEVPNGDGVLILKIKGETIKFPLEELLQKPYLPGVSHQHPALYPVGPGKPTRELLSIARVSALTGNDLLGTQGLFFSFHYPPSRR